MSHSDHEDVELKAAIALSLAECDAKPQHEQPMQVPSSEPAPPSGGFAGLDRQAMERERLARQAKKRGHERSISPPAARKAPKLETTTLNMESGAKLNMIVQHDQAGRKSNTARAANDNLKAETTTTTTTKSGTEPADSTQMLAQGELAYPNGVVKKTWAFGHERTGNEIKLEEVLEPRSVRTALLSAFQWDTEWVLSKLKVPSKGGTTKCIFVMQAKDQALREQMVRETEGMRSFLRLCFPPMDGQVHCMHSKLMLLFHQHKLRVAVPSANLLNFDWGETGMMENSVFIIDLPRLADGASTNADALTAFGKELMYFLEKQGVDQGIRDGVLNFNFAATSNMAFVHTVGGVMHADEAERTGLPGLARTVRSLGLQANELQIDFAASSIGSLNDDYLRAVHSAARGEDMIARSTAAASKAKADFFKPGKPVPTKSIRDDVRIYFPTYETVTSSTAKAAGTICLSRKWYENMPFPRSVFRDYISVRKGMLSHNKILYARGKRRAENERSVDDVAWVYVGSANMSESAWGKLVYDKKIKAWKINCRNWECGVLLPVPADKLASVRKPTAKPASAEAAEGDDSETESESGDDVNRLPQSIAEVIGMEVFDGIVSPPFEYPGRTYQGREPWYFQERHDR